MLDDFETLRDWQGVTSQGVTLEISSDTGRGGRVMRMDVDFGGGGGYAIAQKVFVVDLPQNYEFSFQVRGDFGPNDLEFKLIEPGGENVWWRNHRAFEFPREWRRVGNRKRQIEFAWGPAGGGDMRRLAVIEIAITAGSGGRGSVWLDDLTFRPLPPERPYDLVPAAAASSSRRGSRPSNVLRPGASSVWRSEAGGEQWLMLDFLQRREIGGVVIDWARAEHARDYSVQISDDGREWETRYAVRNGAGGRDHIHLPETEGRYLRLVMSGGAGESYAVAALDVKPPDWAPTRNDFIAEVAKDFPRGSFPRPFTGEQTYWTLVGVDGGRNEALLSEDGALELGRGLASIEPFLHVDGKLVTWSDVAARQALERGSLPIPSVHWDAAPLALTVTAWATGAVDSATLHARYRVTNRSSSAKSGSLFLAIRPFQVNPPWQFLNLQGGTARVRILEHDGRFVYLNAIERRIVPVSTPSGFGAAGFDQGDVTEYLRAGVLPPFSALSDDEGRISGALAFALSLAPGETRDIYIAVPLDRAAVVAEPRQSDAAARAYGEAKLAESVVTWERTLGRVTVELPRSARHVSETLRSTLAYILINRDGPAIQPGSRSYERSWIRDGSLTSAALLRLGHPEPVRQFAEWYAPFQHPGGRVPCCVDARGADAVPEHDSHGQLIYLITEYYRYAGDRAFAERMWPHVSRAVTYIDSLRRQRMTDEYRFERRAYFGMVPESISHEGYSAKPMHSYWDAFFVLKGLKDAAWLAAELDRDAERIRIARMRDEFRRDLLQSFQLTMEEHGIDYLAGSVELGDFDATSTTVGLTPAGELSRLPRDAVERTFERYLEETTARAEGRREWDAYTPYELRTVGTFVRLGRKADAHRLLDWFFADQRPRGWNHWAEVVWRDPRAPRFIGDMPHTWVGSDFIRSVIDMFVYEREADESIVIGAGIPEAWAREDSGAAIRNVRTHYGPLSYTVRAVGNEATYQLSGELAVPYGGMVIRSPIDSPVREALVDGRPAARNEVGEIVIHGLPAEVVIKH